MRRNILLDEYAAALVCRKLITFFTVGKLSP